MHYQIPAKEQTKIDAFIAAGKVTHCPGCFTKELAIHDQRLTQEFLDMTPEQRTQYYKSRQSWGRRGTRGRKPISQQERMKRQKQSQATWYKKNKEKRAAYQRKRRAEKNQIDNNQPDSGE